MLPGMEQLVLKRGEERRLRSGHLWVFSNEVHLHPKAAAGDLVEVRSAGGSSLGTALYHPHSLISARLLDSSIPELDPAFFSERIQTALTLREQMLPGEDCFRLVHGESDLLPGLIVDRYGPDLVVQFFCAGMDRRQACVLEALNSLLRPRCVVERNDSGLRDYEELPRRSGVIQGEGSGPAEIVESGIRYRIDLLTGQKTGFFLDQKLNRRLVAGLCAGRRVLDCFCNVGGFSLHAARAGAHSVTAVDASAASLELAATNALLNQMERISWVNADVFDFLADAAASADRFDLVILDPPSFAQRRKDLPKARKAYRRLNELGMQCLTPGGILITASCSHHLPEHEFYEAVSEASVRAGVRIQLLERRGASPDHPVLPAMPETAYLKLGMFRVRAGR